MSVLRKHNKERFTTVDNTILEDTRLSWRARGIAVFILSKPDGWSANINHIASQGAEGQVAVKSALRELAEFGYLTRTRENDDKGQLRTVTHIADYPAFIDTGTVESRVRGYESKDDFTDQTENEGSVTWGSIVNTELANTDKERTISDEIVDGPSAAHSNHLAPPIEIEQDVLPLFGDSAARVKPAKKPSKAKRSAAYVNSNTGVSTADIQTFYVAALQEHEPGAVVNFGQTGRAAKALAQAGWTAVDATRCYVDMKREPFYQNKHLSLSEVAKQIGARLGKSSPPVIAATPKEGIRSNDGRKVLAMCRVRDDTILRLMLDADLGQGDRLATPEDVQAAAAAQEMEVDDFLARKFYGQIARGE